jgi:hypothetical protein
MSGFLADTINPGSLEGRSSELNPTAVASTKGLNTLYIRESFVILAFVAGYT